MSESFGRIVGYSDIGQSCAGIAEPFLMPPAPRGSTGIVEALQASPCTKRGWGAVGNIGQRASCRQVTEAIAPLIFRLLGSAGCGFQVQRAMVKPLKTIT